MVLVGDGGWRVVRGDLELRQSDARGRVFVQKPFQAVLRGGNVTLMPLMIVMTSDGG